jgi:streptomycin 6-kinase
VRVPDGLAWLRSVPTGPAWLDALPDVVAAVAARWGLEVGEPYDGSHLSWAAPARRGGDAVVLKVQWPHPECAGEAAALAHWAGDGAVRLLAHDADHAALLLERCEPGTHLAGHPGTDAVGVLVSLLPRLWKPADVGFPLLAAEATRWAATMVGQWELAGRPCERRLVDAAVGMLSDLAADQGEQVLLHQDLHGDNVLAARRTPWLAIDPKPLVGEREFSVAPIVRSSELGHTREAVTGRLDRLCSELGLDRQRARWWTVGQTMAWSFSSPAADRHHATARWLLDRRAASSR